MSGNEATDSASHSPQCNSCMKNLVSALESATSKTQTLLHSIGVHMSNDFVRRNTNSVVIDVPLIERKHSKSVGFGGLQFDNVVQANATIQSDTTLTESKENHRKSLNTSNINLKVEKPKSTTVDELSSISKSLMSLEISCQKCGTTGPEGGARAFVKGPHPLSIVLCSNRLFSKEDIEQVLIHELVHVYDVYVRKWDLTDCKSLAKSEVRAARFAECANSSMNITKRYCSKDKARVATTNMFPDIGVKCVADVFDEAMQDLSPFHSHEEINSRNYSCDIDKESQKAFERKSYTSFR